VTADVQKAHTGGMKWKSYIRAVPLKKGWLHTEVSYTAHTDIRVFIKQKVHYLRVACFKPDERTWCVVLTDFGLHHSYASINSRITDVFTEPTMPIKKGFMNQIFNQSHFKGTKEIRTNKPVPEQYRNTLSFRTVTSYGLEDSRNRTVISGGSNRLLSFPKRPDRL
jgi:hypothetical protein